MRLLALLSLHREVPALRRAWRDPRTPLAAKALLVAALAYVLLPMDLVSDLIPVLGWLDDVAVVTLALTLFKRLTVRAVMAPA